MSDNPTLQARIRDALVYSFPVHDVAQTRWQFTQNSGNRTQPGAPPNVLHHNRRLLNHRARTVTMPNNDTLYSIAWLDLSGGPLLLSLPEMHDRYYSFAFLDIFTNNAACIGRRTTGTAAVTFLLAGPGWQGEAPAGTRLLRLPSHDIWMLGRVLVDGEDDLPAVHALQDAMRLAPLDAGSAPRLLQTQPDERSPERYLELVNEVMGRNPVPAHEQALVASYADLGLRPGVHGAWQALDPAVRQAWTETHAANLHDLRKTPPGTFYRSGRGGSWSAGVDHLGNFGNDYAYRAFVSLVGLGALEREEAIYFTAMTDGKGEPLDGAHRYRLAIPTDMQVDAFWSLTMYEFAPDGRRFFTDNPLQRYALGDRTPGLVRRADGAFDIWLQHDAPDSAEERANWLPAPGGRFSLALRFYQPRRALLDRSFDMPEVERLD